MFEFLTSLPMVLGGIIPRLTRTTRSATSSLVAFFFWQDRAVFLTGLNHVNVRTHRLAEMIAFYRDVLGMRQGPRPGFSFGGAWMYVAEQPVVHLVSVDVAPVPGDSLRLQHFAFAAQDQAGFLAHLETHHVLYRVGRLEDFKITQVNVQDPDGNYLHVDFVG